MSVPVLVQALVQLSALVAEALRSVLTSAESAVLIVDVVEDGSFDDGTCDGCGEGLLAFTALLDTRSCESVCRVNSGGERAFELVVESTNSKYSLF